jgi:hypothetical protein
MGKRKEEQTESGVESPEKAVNSAGESIDKVENEDKTLVTATGGADVSLDDSQKTAIKVETEGGKESKADAKDPNITTVDKDDPESSKNAKVVANQPDIPDDKIVDGSGDPAATAADGVPNDSNTAKGAHLNIEEKTETTREPIVLVKNVSGQNMDFYKGTDKFTIQKYGRIPTTSIPTWVKQQLDYQDAFKNKDLQLDTI